MYSFHYYYLPPLQRAERDRDNLMKTNARLLAQSAEKDEMNARSLSTILHLNQMSEQLTQEKDLLEQMTILLRGMGKLNYRINIGR